MKTPAKILTLAAETMALPFTKMEGERLRNSCSNMGGDESSSDKQQEGGLGDIGRAEEV